MMRETQKDGPKDLRPVSLEELKKHSHQAGRPVERLEPRRFRKIRMIFRGGWRLVTRAIGLLLVDLLWE